MAVILDGGWGRLKKNLKRDTSKDHSNDVCSQLAKQFQMQEDF